MNDIQILLDELNEQRIKFSEILSSKGIQSYDTEKFNSLIDKVKDLSASKPYSHMIFLTNGLTSKLGNVTIGTSKLSKYQYYRMTITKTAGTDNYLGISEIKLSMSEDIPMSYPAPENYSVTYLDGTSGSFYGGEGTNKLFDGDTTGSHMTMYNGKTKGAIISWNYSELLPVATISICTMHDSYGSGRAPKDFKIEAKKNADDDWTIIAEKTNAQYNNYVCVCNIEEEK